MFRIAATVLALMCFVGFAAVSHGKHGGSGGGGESWREQTGRSDRSGSFQPNRAGEAQKSNGSGSADSRTSEPPEPENSVPAKDENTNSGSSGSNALNVESENSGSSNAVEEDDEPKSGNSGSGSHGSGRNGKSGDSASGQTFHVKRDASGFEYVGERAIMVLPDEASVGELIRAGYVVHSKERLQSAGLILVQIGGAQSEAKMLASLRRLKPRASASYNHVYRPDWGVHPGKVSTEAPPKTPGRVSVGLIDARVDAAHPMLRNVRIKAAHFEDGTPSRSDHATSLASVFAARQEEVDLFAASVFVETGDDSIGASAVSIARALDWLSSEGVRIVNVSLSGPPNEVLEQVIARLSTRGQMIVAAVGNDGPNRQVKHPAAYPGVVGVTAVDAKHAIYRYANRGPGVDFSALGVGLRVAATGGSMRVVSGTSFAAPVVALEMARLTDEYGDPLEAQNAMRRSAVDLGAPGCDIVYGCGLVSAR